MTKRVKTLRLGAFELKFRLYYLFKKEIVELYHEENGQVVIDYQDVSPCGENLIKLCANEFYSSDTILVIDRLEPLFDQLDKEELTDTLFHRILVKLKVSLDYSPYFAYIYAVVNNQYRLYKSEGRKPDKDAITTCINHYRRCNVMLQEIADVCTCCSYGVIDNYMNPCVFEYLKHKLPLQTEITRITFEIAREKDETYQIVDKSIAEEYCQEMVEVSGLDMVRVLHPTTFEDVANYTATMLIMKEIRFKRCKNCGQLFIPSKYNQVEYCDRIISAAGKTCRQLGATKVYQKKKGNDPIDREYTKSYKKHNARVRYGIMTREEFSNWSQEARVKREQCRDGELPFEDFVDWLKK